MFRRERPQKGRYRQFFQIGAEAIGPGVAVRRRGSDRDGGRDPARGRDLDGFKLLINSVGCKNCRPQFIARCAERLKDVAPQMCGDCQRRADTNPLRVLDCKVPEDQPIIDALPSILDYLDEACRTHFAARSRVSGRPRHRI